MATTTRTPKPITKEQVFSYLSTLHAAVMPGVTPDALDKIARLATAMLSDGSLAVSRASLGGREATILGETISGPAGTVCVVPLAVLFDQDRDELTGPQGEPLVNSHGERMGPRHDERPLSTGMYL